MKFIIPYFQFQEIKVHIKEHACLVNINTHFTFDATIFPIFKRKRSTIVVEL